LSEDAYLSTIFKAEYLLASFCLLPNLALTNKYYYDLRMTLLLLEG